MYATPSFYIEWSLSKGIKPDWLDFAIDKGFFKPKKIAENNETDRPIHKRTENNYLRLIMVLANGIKGFNPNKPFEAPQLIIDETGVQIKQDTLASYISRAYELESKKGSNPN